MIHWYIIHRFLEIVRDKKNIGVYKLPLNYDRQISYLTPNVPFHSSVISLSKVLASYLVQQY